MSDRFYRSGEPWAMDHYKNILDNPQGDVVPTYVEVDFSNACNFKCSYCSPQFSTAWAQEVEEHGSFPTQPIHNDPSHFKGKNKVMPQNNNPYVDAFWKWWPELYPQLRHFRMTGGEPMMDKNTFKVFEYIIDNPKKDFKGPNQLGMDSIRFCLKDGEHYRSQPENKDFAPIMEIHSVKNLKIELNKYNV